jgi:hypothetical protein
MVTYELLLLLVVLILQPLIAIAYAYVAYRMIASFTADRTGAWVDNRVDKATESVKEVVNE